MLLHERVEQIKVKVLDVLEKRVNDDTSIEELKDITYALNQIDDDKNFYLKMLSSLSGSGFNGKSNPTITDCTEKAE